MVWLGFAASLATILIISKKNLAGGIIAGAVVLGLFTLPGKVLVEQIIRTGTDMSVLLLALAMGLVPLLGGAMKAGGQIDSLVANLRIPRRYLLAVSAALMGLLPMPGGALLSAPILEKGGETVPPDLISAINNWFRHLFILIYPLSPALIVSAKITGLDVYHAVLYLLPGFALALALGYIFFLRQVDGRVVNQGSFSLSRLSVPLIVILSAPALDFLLKRLFNIGSLATLIGVSTALILSILLSPGKINMIDIVKRMRPWNFAFIIVGMFLYLYIFQASPAGAAIAALPLPPLILAVTAGFVLSVLTGRVQLPASIIFPMYIGAAGAVTAPIFAIIYVAVYFGYIISPVHPCLVVTCEYFRVPIRAMVSRLAVPTLVVLACVLGLSFLFAR
jgi:integral membrane protein (TIGR00529 family)